MGRRRTDTGLRARAPDAEGVVEREGVRVHWEAFGAGEPTILLLPSWSILHSRFWKAQVPYLSRHFQVVTFDGRGNGLSDRPDDPGAYATEEFAEDAAAVLDAAGVSRAVLAGVSLGALWGLRLAVDHPERVLGAFILGPSVPLLTDTPRLRGSYSFTDVLDTEEGWAKENIHYWRRDWRGYLEFFFSEIFTEPHSTKQIEDAVAWGLDTSPETMAITLDRLGIPDREAAELLCRSARCPVYVVHGSDDHIQPLDRGRRLAELTGGQLVVFDGGGHAVHAREPVRVNLLLRDFASSLAPAAATTRTWTRPLARGKTALYVSSPIGLGHAWRDVAIARELRRRVPGLEIQWLAQPPVTSVLESCGELIHPASAHLASEAAHIEREAREHELNAFETLRRMDEILVANFMVFHDVVREQPYDAWIGDEAWELDYFLHENPELKTAPFAWLTDFVGFLPLPEGGEREAMLAADYNAEMIEQVERFPRVRDRAIFVGDPVDILPGSFGPGLPPMREWIESRFEFSGHILGFDPATLPPRETLRAELGWEPHERVVLVTVGGSGVGEQLLRRACEALPALRERVPNLRLVAVAGPSIDPATLPSEPGLDVHAYVHELHRLLAGCDVAVVQGGLSTGMELIALGRPFISIPLRRHFEQQLHVRHRLDRHGADVRLDYEEVSPERIAVAVAAALETEPAYAQPRAGAAGRAAASIAQLL